VVIGQVGNSNLGHSGAFGYGCRNADGFRVLRVCRLVTFSHLQQIMKQDAKLMSYASGPVEKHCGLYPYETGRQI